MALVHVGELFHLGLWARYPTGGGELAGFKAHGQGVFFLDARGQHFKLQLAHHAHNIARADHGFKHFGGTLFGKLHQGFFQMLGFHGVECAHTG